MNISIKEPCHEDWSKMTPNEKGAFCLVCTKDVVDFSKRSLEEIKSYFSQPREGKTCGKFNNDQLDAINFDSFFERFTGFKLTRKVALVIAVTFMSWFMGGSTLSAQDDGQKKGMVAVRHEPNTTTTNGNVVNKQDTTKTAKHSEMQTAGEVSISKVGKKTKREVKGEAEAKAKAKAEAENKAKKAKAKAEAENRSKKAKEPAPHLLGDVDINYDETKKDEKKN